MPAAPTATLLLAVIAAPVPSVNDKVPPVTVVVPPYVLILLNVTVPPLVLVSPTAPVVPARIAETVPAWTSYVAADVSMPVLPVIVPLTSCALATD